MSDAVSRMYVKLPDGTAKQSNPLSGDEVRVIPERVHRPRPKRRAATREPLMPRDPEDACDFCAARYDRTTPEKARVVRDGSAIVRKERVPAGCLFEDRALFRRIGNLFEIVTHDYWVKNHGFRVPAAIERWLDEYLEDPAGRAHLCRIVGYKLECMGKPAQEIEALLARRLRELSIPFFAGSHDLILAERHYRAQARTTGELASSGCLTPDDHHEYVRFTLDTARSIARGNPHVRQITIFQNWLEAGGASFEHLHKQVMGIDEWGALLERKIALETSEPGAFHRYALDFAIDRGLVIAANDGAIAFADVGQRTPTVTLISTDCAADIRDIDPQRLGDLSDLLHACHAATGPALATNEEWQMRPLDCPVPIPLHVHLRWRMGRAAGFEGTTRIHVVPLLPEEVRDRTITRMRALQGEGRIRNLRIGKQAELRRGALRYR